MMRFRSLPHLTTTLLRQACQYIHRNICAPNPIHRNNSDNFVLYYRRSRISRLYPVFSVFSVGKSLLPVPLVDSTESLLLRLRPRKLVRSPIGLEKLCFWHYCIKGIVIITNLVPIRKCLLTIILHASFGSGFGFVDSKHVGFIWCYLLL